MWKLTTAPEEAPSTPEKISIEFKQGLPIRVTVLADGKEYTDSVEIFLALNALGRKHGIGRIDIVENRFIGVKSRGCYESPGATILRVAHIDLEGLTLDRNVRALRDQFTTVEFSKILYNGHFFTPEREFITAAIPASQRTVNGLVRLKLYKGNVVVEGRESSEVWSKLSIHYFWYTHAELYAIGSVWRTPVVHGWTWRFRAQWYDRFHPDWVHQNQKVGFHFVCYHVLTVFGTGGHKLISSKTKAVWRPRTLIQAKFRFVVHAFLDVRYFPLVEI